MQAGVLLQKLRRYAKLSRRESRVNRSRCEIDTSLSSDFAREILVCFFLAEPRLIQSDDLWTTAVANPDPLASGLYSRALNIGVHVR